MKQITLGVVLIIVATAAITLPAWAVLGLRPPSYISSEPVLQAIAEQSCRCARYREDDAGKASCWRRFEASAGPTSPRAAPSTGTCAGLTERRRCYLSGACVTLEYRSPSGKDSFCGRHEAIMARAIFIDDGDDRTLSALARYFSAGNVGGGASPEMADGFSPPACPIPPHR